MEAEIVTSDPWVLNFIGYLTGVLVHVGCKWTDDYQTTKKWNTFWQASAGYTIQNGVFALIVFVLWQTGTLRKLFDMAGIPDLGLPINFGTSLFAGYILDSIGKNIVPASLRQKLESKPEAPKP